MKKQALIIALIGAITSQTGQAHSAQLETDAEKALMLKETADTQKPGIESLLALARQLEQEDPITAHNLYQALVADPRLNQQQRQLIRLRLKQTTRPNTKLAFTFGQGYDSNYNQHTDAAAIELIIDDQTYQGQILQQNRAQPQAYALFEINYEKPLQNGWLINTNLSLNQAYNLQQRKLNLLTNLLIPLADTTYLHTYLNYNHNRQLGEQANLGLLYNFQLTSANTLAAHWQLVLPEKAQFQSQLIALNWRYQPNQTAYLSLQGGIDQPHQNRPGGAQKKLNLLATKTYTTRQGTASLYYALLASQDGEVYSAIMSPGQKRHQIRQTIGTTYAYQAGLNTQYVFDLQYWTQQSNYRIFQAHGWLGQMSIRWKM